MPISTLKGAWRRILSEDRLRRSSHALSVVEGNVCIFGGEVQPRQPVDNQVDIVSLKAGNTSHVHTASRQHGAAANARRRCAPVRDQVAIHGAQRPRGQPLGRPPRPHVPLLGPRRHQHDAHRRRRRSMVLPCSNILLVLHNARRRLKAVPASTKLPLLDQRWQGQHIHTRIAVSCWRSC